MSTINAKSSQFSVFDGDPSRLLSLGWDERVESALAGLVDGLSPGRVARVERGGACVVALADGDHAARSSPTAPVAVGDWVGVGRRADTLFVEAIGARWSQLTRHDPEGRLQVLASNMDIVFITAPADRPSISRVERETALAWDSGARPVVLLTKSDVAEPDLAERLRERLLGVDVVVTSAVTGDGLDQVVSSLGANGTAVLLGPSGAGKSSLANLLLGASRLEVGEVRAGDRRGRHTTTSRQLIALPGGGVLIDTPGLRSLSLVGEEGVAAAFSDVEELAAGCRFSDCRHEGEPGCAVVEAVEDGTLDPARVANYHKLRREMEYLARRDDPVARAEAERVWRIRARASRQFFRDRERRR